MKTEQERHTQQRTSGLSNASWLFCIAAALLLSSCGFQLRGQAALPFETIHIIGSPLVVVQLTRAVRAGTTTQVVANEKEADATLQIPHVDGAGTLEFSSPAFSVVENQGSATITVSRVPLSTSRCSSDWR